MADLAKIKLNNTIYNFKDESARSSITSLTSRITTLENLPWVTYYTGSSEPDANQGNDGDLYFQTEEA